MDLIILYSIMSGHGNSKFNRATLRNHDIPRDSSIRTISNQISGGVPIDAGSSNIALETGGNLASIVTNTTGLNLETTQQLVEAHTLGTFTECVNINAKLPALGQQTTANSQSVVFASDAVGAPTTIADVNVAGGATNQTTPLLVQFEPSVPFGSNPVLRNDLASIDLTTVSKNIGNANAGCQRMTIASDNVIQTRKYSGTYWNTLLNDPVDSNNTNANKNYSGAGLGLRDFKYIATQDGEKITRLIVAIIDGNIRQDRYGDIVALTNGVQVYILPSGGSKQYLTSFPITTTGGWGLQCYDLQVPTMGGDPIVLIRWTFDKMRELTLDTGDEFGVEVNDDLTGLVSHYFNIQGHQP